MKLRGLAPSLCWCSLTFLNHVLHCLSREHHMNGKCPREGLLENKRDGLANQWNSRAPGREVRFQIQAIIYISNNKGRGKRNTEYEIILVWSRIFFFYTNIYLLFASREVRIRKNRARGLKLSRQRAQFFQIRTDLGWWITFLLFFLKLKEILSKRTRMI